MVAPLVFIALDQANLEGAREVLKCLPREGIFLQTETLTLETSWMGRGARDFYATAWRWSLADIDLLFGLAWRGRLLVTVETTVIVCCPIRDIGRDDDSLPSGCEQPAEGLDYNLVLESIEPATLVSVHSPQELAEVLAGVTNNTSGG